MSAVRGGGLPEFGGSRVGGFRGSGVLGWGSRFAGSRARRGHEARAPPAGWNSRTVFLVRRGLQTWRSRRDIEGAIRETVGRGLRPRRSGDSNDIMKSQHGRSVRLMAHSIKRVPPGARFFGPPYKPVLRRAARTKERVENFAANGGTSRTRPMAPVISAEGLDVIDSPAPTTPTRDCEAARRPEV